MSDPFAITELPPLPPELPEPLAGIERAGLPAPSLPRVLAREVVGELTRQRTRLSLQLEDQSRDRQHAMRAFLRRILAVLDSMDRILHGLPSTDESAETISILRRQLLQILEDEQVSLVEVSPGDSFNGDLCEVAERRERPDLQPGTVIAVERRGYLWKDRLLRPARVIIAYQQGA